jgi:hypothetical protein
MGSAFVAGFTRQFQYAATRQKERASHPAFEQALERPEADGPMPVSTGKAHRGEPSLDRKASRSI